MSPEQLHQLKWVMNETRERLERGFYGEITIKIVEGRVVLMQAQESAKPPPLNRNL